MKVHEYQGKEIFRRFGVAVLEGHLATTVDDAVAAARKIGKYPVVVKAQIHAGGRGKGGGVKLAKTEDEVRAHAKAILGMQLVTHQTGPKGQKVRKLFIEAGCNIARELYLGLLLDRESSRLTFIASNEGGMEIEKVAEETPEKLLKVQVDPATGLSPFQVRQMGYFLKLDGPAMKSAMKFLPALYKAYGEMDCTLVEINPLVVTKEGELVALDAKVNFDDNALYRHPDVEEMRDPDEEDAKENEAKKYDLSYISLDGNVGCMVNGAGLAMATMDAIKFFGGAPANFLDVGGGATQDKVTAAFKIILSDPNVKAVLVNIFGGIAKCDVIAGGVVGAAKEVGLKVPLVVRLEGTNVDLGRKILKDSGLPITSAEGVRDAAEKVVKAAASA
ncbi:MAG: ADP-forming succinate--CoA ligase subunit beta [Deltaproteobacteria bacterium]|nr:ADP-forming succinate--CoA ligase subunit beta [Deltaproteobacteria bacterium]